MKMCPPCEQLLCSIARVCFARGWMAPLRPAECSERWPLVSCHRAGWSDPFPIASHWSTWLRLRPLMKGRACAQALPGVARASRTAAVSAPQSRQQTWTVHHYDGPDHLGLTPPRVVQVVEAELLELLASQQGRCTHGEFEAAVAARDAAEAAVAAAAERATAAEAAAEAAEAGAAAAEAATAAAEEAAAAAVVAGGISEAALTAMAEDAEAKQRRSAAAAAAAVAEAEAAAGDVCRSLARQHGLISIAVPRTRNKSPRAFSRPRPPRPRSPQPPRPPHPPPRAPARAPAPPGGVLLRVIIIVWLFFVMPGALARPEWASAALLGRATLHSAEGSSLRTGAVALQDWTAPPADNRAANARSECCLTRVAPTAHSLHRNSLSDALAPPAPLSTQQTWTMLHCDGPNHPGLRPQGPRS